MERKQDALRGVESPLIFMVHNRVPTQGPGSSTPDGASIADASTALVDSLACPGTHPRRPEGTQTTTPDRDKPLDPVAIKIRESACPSQPNHTINTRLLFAFCSYKRQGQRCDIWQRFFGNGDYYPRG